MNLFMKGKRTPYAETLVKVIVNDCLTCGKAIEANPYHIKVGQKKYCSKDCYTKAMYTGSEIECIQCHKKAYFCKYLVDNKLRKFCSAECQRKYEQEHLTGKYFNCARCGKEFYLTDYYINVAKLHYCSRACMDWGKTDLKSRIRGTQLYKEWRLAVILRDNKRCRDCGIRTAYLEAHHIVGFTEILVKYNIQTVKDAIKHDILWDIDNGVTLCLDCHQRTYEETGRMLLSNSKKLAASALIYGSSSTQRTTKEEHISGYTE